MRIDLVTPFAEKDAAKALGARWDSAKKTWYVTGVADLTPFSRWMADSKTPATSRGPAVRKPTGSGSPTPAAGTITVSTHAVAHCGCAVLPWESCVHSGRSGD